MVDENRFLPAAGIFASLLPVLLCVSSNSAAPHHEYLSNSGMTSSGGNLLRYDAKDFSQLPCRYGCFSVVYRC